MTPNRIFAWGAALFIGLSPLAATAQSLGQISLSPADMRATAAAALTNQQPARALALAEALLLRDDTDPLALRVGAQAALVIGEIDVAVRHGRALFYTSNDPDTRFAAARLVALALAQDEKFTRSQIWLRRARQVAANDADANSVAEDYVIVRNRNPLRYAFDFGVRPSSNLNGGSSQEEYDIVFFGVPLTLPFVPKDRALSGYTATASASLSYRLDESATSFTNVSFGVSGSRSFLDSESRDLAPDFDEGQLSYWQVQAGISHVWAAGSQGQPASLSFSHELTLRDGQLDLSEATLTHTRRWQVADATVLTGTLQLGQFKDRDRAATANNWTSAVSVRHALDNGHVLGFNTAVGQSNSADASYDYGWHSFGARYDLGRVADRFDVAFSADLTHRDYESFFFQSTLRSDKTTTLSIDVGVPDLELYGFSPVFSLEAERRSSTITRYQSDSIGLDINFRSNF